MSVEKRIFNIAKDPSEKILDFLRKEPDKAFSLQEIYNGINELKEFDIPLDSIEEKLDYLKRFQHKIEIAWLLGEEYYSIVEEQVFEF